MVYFAKRFRNEDNAKYIEVRELINIEDSLQDSEYKDYVEV